MSQYGSACSERCGHCGHCSAGPDPRRVAWCQQCGEPFVIAQPSDRICDQCAGWNAQEARDAKAARQ